jgi:carbonic anhydrase/acetyltransferase-like protein (isoleucine patch superfamily)
MELKYEIVLQEDKKATVMSRAAKLWKRFVGKDKIDPNLIALAYPGVAMMTAFSNVPKYLYRIRKKSGELGGWIESPQNLSQAGDCWIYPNAIVCGNAMVTGNAQIKGGQIGGDVSVGGNAVVEGANTVIDGKCSIYGSVSDSNIFARGWYYVESDANNDFSADMVGKSEETAGVAEEAEEQEEVEDPGMVNEVTVLDGGKVTNGSIVFGRARIYGEVDHACVGGNAIVYGKVSDGAIVVGKSMVAAGGEVSGKVILGRGTVTTRCVGA